MLAPEAHRLLTRKARQERTARRRWHRADSYFALNLSRWQAAMYRAALEYPLERDVFIGRSYGP